MHGDTDTERSETTEGNTDFEATCSSITNPPSPFHTSYATKYYIVKHHLKGSFNLGKNRLDGC